MANSSHSDVEKVNEPSPHLYSSKDAVDAQSIRSTITPVPTHPEETNLPLQDGGARAWLQVLGSFLVFINLWGFVFAYGAFQSFYELQYLTDATPSAISWVGTVASFLLIVVGVISGPLFDLGYFKAMLLTGAFVETLSLFLLSLCSRYWQIMLTQGILQGLGNGLLYLPGLALVGRSFTKRRALAMSVISCGAPVGGIIYTVLFERLINTLDFAWTVRVMAFVMLATYLISFPLLLWGVENLGDLASGQPRKLFDITALRDGPFWAYSMSNFFIFLGYLTPFFYMGTFGQTELGLTRSFSLNVIVISQATSTVGRLVVGYCATRTGIVIPWAWSGLASGVLCIAWAGVKSKASFVVFGALYGFFSGALIPLPPSVFPRVCPWPEILGARLGMAQAINSIATLIGAPIAGALLTVNTNSKPGGQNYLALQLFSGITISFATLLIGVLWFLLWKQRGTGKIV